MGGLRTFGAAAVGMSLLVSGCVKEPEDGAARLREIREQSEDLKAALDTVEERLLGNQAQVHLWAELARRHQQVSELHCRHHGKHFEAIARHQLKQEEKARRLRRARLASAARARARLREQEAVLTKAEHAAERHSARN